MTFSDYKLVAASVVLCFASAATDTVYAQECKPDEETTWWPGRYSIFQAREVSTADRAAIDSKLATVEALVRRTAPAAGGDGGLSPLQQVR